jgi:hypothetical protein
MKFKKSEASSVFIGIHRSDSGSYRGFTAALVFQKDYVK